MFIYSALVNWNHSRFIYTTRRYLFIFATERLRDANVVFRRTVFQLFLGRIIGFCSPTGTSKNHFVPSNFVHVFGPLWYRCLKLTRVESRPTQTILRYEVLKIARATVHLLNHQIFRSINFIIFLYTHMFGGKKSWRRRRSVVNFNTYFNYPKV